MLKLVSVTEATDRILPEDAQSLMDRRNRYVSFTSSDSS